MGEGDYGCRPYGDEQERNPSIDTCPLPRCQGTSTPVPTPQSVNSPPPTGSSCAETGSCSYNGTAPLGVEHISCYSPTNSHKGTCSSHLYLGNPTGILDMLTAKFHQLPLGTLSFVFSLPIFLFPNPFTRSTQILLFSQPQLWLPLKPSLFTRWQTAQCFWKS